MVHKYIRFPKIHQIHTDQTRWICHAEVSHRQSPQDQHTSQETTACCGPLAWLYRNSLGINATKWCSLGGQRGAKRPRHIAFGWKQEPANRVDNWIFVMQLELKQNHINKCRHRAHPSVTRLKHPCATARIQSRSAKLDKSPGFGIQGPFFEGKLVWVLER